MGTGSLKFQFNSSKFTEHDIIISYIKKYNISKIRWGMFSIYVSLLLYVISVHSNIYIIITLRDLLPKFTTYKITNDRRASLIVQNQNCYLGKYRIIDINNISLAFEA